jgi:hypothetical protein
MWRWLVREWQWPAAALFAAVALFAVLPVVAVVSGLGLALIVAQLPVYMVHQWEEHSGDRFRRYINRVVGGGREALTPGATFWINSLGVWAVDLAAMYLAVAVAPRAGLVAGYLAVVNALLHIGPALARREYNPGLITAVVLFLPLGGWCVAEAGAGAGLAAHLAGAAGALGVHVAIIAHVVRRLRRLPNAAGPRESPRPRTGQGAVLAAGLPVSSSSMASDCSISPTLKPNGPRPPL